MTAIAGPNLRVIDRDQEVSRRWWRRLCDRRCCRLFLFCLRGGRCAEGEVIGAHGINGVPQLISFSNAPSVCLWRQTSCLILIEVPVKLDGAPVTKLLPRLV